MSNDFVEYLIIEVLSILAVPMFLIVAAVCY